MISLASVAKSIRVAIGRFTSEPDVAVLSFGTVNASGAVVSQDGLLTTIPGDGAIAIRGGVVALTKGSAAAITLAAPTTAQNNTIIEVINGSAFAHVITATTLISDGVTGGAKSTMTFGAFVGSAITLRAYAGKWTVMSKNVVTVAA